jgi:DnaK suppressor protein
VHNVVQPPEGGAEESRKMTTQECTTKLLAKRFELRSRHVRREDIAIEKNAETLDEIQQSADRVLALDSMTRNWELSSLIAEALARIENQTYGVCAECDEKISEKRIAALPWAKYCIRCQEAVDRASSEVRWDYAA